MMQIFMIGLGAGAASALLFASLMSGSLLSVFLFYLAPLPILVAALGWTHWSGLFGAIGAALAFALIFNAVFGIAYLIGAALPAWWLGYLALLARPIAGTTDVDWYPAGRLIIWAAIVAAIIVVLVISNFGADEENLRGELRKFFESALASQPPAATQAPLRVPSSNTEKLLDVMVVILPLLGAAMVMLAHVLNLWLAGRIVLLSGRLRRPWPDLPAMRFPIWVPALLAFALAASFLPNLFGTAATIVAVTFLLAYALLGFAVLHTITRGSRYRGLVLGGTYAITLVIGWPLFFMSLLGLADTAFDLRARMAQGGTSNPSV